MAEERKSLRQVIEAAAESSYESRRIKSNSKPWNERSEDERRRYLEAIAAAFDFLPTVGYAVTRSGAQPGGVPGRVMLPLEQARSLWNAFARSDASREESLKAFTALQAAIAAAEANYVPEGKRDSQG